MIEGAKTIGESASDPMSPVSTSATFPNPSVKEVPTK